MTTPMVSHIRVALFDLDDTLFEHRGAVRDGIAAHLRETLPHVDAAAHQDRWDELEEHHYHRYLTGELDYLGQRRARARDFMQPFGIDFPEDHSAERWFEIYLQEYRNAWRLFADAVPCLDELDAAGIRIGLITNGDRDFQLAKLEAMALDSRIEQVITSGELGFAKPDPRIFDFACEKFGVPPSAALYVGDRLHTDAIGAAKAGLTGIWLDRAGAASVSQLAEARESKVDVIETLTEMQRFYQLARS
jgi:putative hydrolase of the HAD superfamily